MIRKFLYRLLTKKTAKSQPSVIEAAIISKNQHRLERHLFSPHALEVTDHLQASGYKAYIVGGALRDLLLGITPKDFDVATNATPEQVQSLFRRAYLIGRRFRLVHVVFREPHGTEIIEVSTFRALVSGSQSQKITGVKSLFRSRRSLDRHSHATDSSGRVLRDNVWGEQEEDAARRDFTINALYYDSQTETIHDYHQGMQDIANKTIRIIGDPYLRYREDPVRMLRAIRFAAKTRFQLAPETAAPIKELIELIRSVPPARIFDEILKLLFSGHAQESIVQLRAAGLYPGLLPLLDYITEQQSPFITLALNNADARVLAGKSVSPSFLFAAILWQPMHEIWQNEQAAGQLPIPALHAAIDQVLEKNLSTLGIQRRFLGDIKEIWLLQPRFERRTPRSATRLLEELRFRAAFDFLLLRCQTGEVVTELGEWWTKLQEADLQERKTLLEKIQKHKNKN